MDPYRILNTLQNIEHIGTSPALWAGFFSDAEEWEGDVPRIVESLSREPTVCAQLLKIANSPHYFRGRQIATVHQAVVHVGLNVVKRIVLAIELIGLYHARQDTSAFPFVQFWKHTLAGGMLSQEIARNNGLREPGQVYVTGLLRNLGILVLRQYFPDFFIEIVDLVREKEMSYRSASAKVCALDHRQIAAHVAMRWNLPERLVFPLDEKSPATKEDLECRRFVRIADTILAKRGYQPWDINFAEGCDETDLLVCGLDNAAEEALCGQVFPQVDDIASQVLL